MNALETKIGELAAWEHSCIPLEVQLGMSRPSVCFHGHTASILKAHPHVGAEGVGAYQLSGEMEKEHEFQEAWTRVQEAVQGLHAAREAIIQRKALELANLIHGDRLNGIRALVDQIQGGAES